MATDTIAIANKTQTGLEKFVKLYNKEPLIHKQLLQIIALSFQFPKRKTLLRSLAKANLHITDKTPLTKEDLNNRLNYLCKKELLTHDLSIHPEILHHIAKDAVSPNNPLRDNNLAILHHQFGYKDHYISNPQEWLSNSRAIHIALYLNDTTLFLQSDFHHINPCRMFIADLLNVCFNCTFDADWVRSRHPVIQLYLLCAKLYGHYAYSNTHPPDLSQWLAFAAQQNIITMAIDHRLEKNTLLMARLLQIAILCKKVSELEPYLAILPADAFYTMELKAMLALLKQDKTCAITYYDKARKMFNADDKSLWLPGNIHGIVLFLTCLYQTIDRHHLDYAGKIIKNLRDYQIPESVCAVFEALLNLKMDKWDAALSLYQRALDDTQKMQFVSPLMKALFHWCTVLIEPGKLSENIKHYHHLFLRYRDSSQYFTAQLYAEIIQHHNPYDKATGDFLKELAPLSLLRFSDILNVKEPWEHAMQQLENLLVEQPYSNKTTVIHPRRLAWLIDPKTLDLEVVEQSILKSGRWGRGRSVSLKRFNELDPSLDYLTSHDLTVIKQGLRCELQGGWYVKEKFHWDRQKTIIALIGHPLVFHRQNRDIPIELIKGNVELHIEKVKKGYHFILSHHRKEAGLILEKETPNRYRVIDFTEDHMSISKILPQQGLTVPSQAKEQVTNVICHTKANIHIHSEIADDNLPTIDSDTTPHMHLLPVGDGIKATLWLKPFGETHACYAPAQGQRSLITTTETTDGTVKQKIIRDFTQEKQRTQALIEQCPVLVEHDNKTLEWCFETLEPSLELLLQLDTYKTHHPLVLEWPQGKPFKVKHQISSNNLSLSIQGSDYWFEYDGNVKINETHSLEMKQLLDLLDHSKGRFVPLANGEFLALTSQFKKQLEELKTISNNGKIHHLNTHALQSLARDVDSLTEDKAWETHLKNIAKMKKYNPTIPDTLQATLRDYQEQGFAYLSRLAHWHIGACLADDMGLGKTVQAITLLLSQAAHGPALVVAPTSVCLIWLEELSKFAPTLKPYTLHDGDDRENLVKSLKKQDVLICGYGLLPQISMLLSSQTWQTIILDEAQAIKNPQTKRWKTVTALQAQCRIALTGTPIENHLGELWSIFHFLNPGLLGSRAFFQQRFSGPIEHNDNSTAKSALKKLVSPYILRRTKSEVLQELPPKIEQSILIEPSDEEMAFYEAVRVKALERIHSLDTSEQNQHFSILHEITRLRQACCHSQLVDKNIQLESSKIKKLLHLINDLLSNNHKALIFSQFVSYLDIVKQHLSQQQLTYQYIDGKTPLKKRKKAVDNFQAGDSNLFLISLKAGGTGLNLTAADYVIILDPWWNPAVEDQAADRAHRMGQDRPVTVYRLIMKNSIEEKITAMHKTKKDLADELLSGSHMTGALSTEELIGLMTN